MATGLSKGQLKAALSEKLGIKTKEAGIVLDTLSTLAAEELSSNSVFNLPGIARFRVVDKKSTPKRQMKSPFTGQMITVKAKAARRIVRARISKQLKEAV